MELGVLWIGINLKKRCIALKRAGKAISRILS